MSNAIRALSMDAVEKANSGHPGMPLGMSDVATILYKYFLNFKYHHLVEHFTETLTSVSQRHLLLSHTPGLFLKWRLYITVSLIKR